MLKHFLFQPGEWLGTGQVSFSMSPDVLHFRTKWVVVEEEPTVFRCTQTVEIVGGDRIINEFQVTKSQAREFEITLENELLGTFSGTGIADSEQVAWEFREKGTFEGFEVYRVTDLSEYSMNAEYISADQMRTMIRGRIWKRTTELPKLQDDEDQESEE